MPGEDVNNKSEAAELTKEQQGFQNLGKEVPFAGAQPEVESSEAKFIKLEELGDICSLENCAIYGHGTGSSGDSHEVVESIFHEGLKGFESLGNMIGENRDEKVSGSTDILDQAVGLWASQEGELDSTSLKEKLNHWKHRESKNIILVRLPQEYFHSMTGVRGEMSKPFYTVHEDTSGHKNHYLDPRFILGNYDTETGLVELNDNFEPEITGDFKAEMDDRLASVKSETATRQAKLEQQAMPGIDNSGNISSDQAHSDLSDLDFDTWGEYSEEDWN